MKVCLSFTASTEPKSVKKLRIGIGLRGQMKTRLQVGRDGNATGRIYKNSFSAVLFQKDKPLFEPKYKTGSRKRVAHRAAFVHNGNRNKAVVSGIS